MTSTIICRELTGEDCDFIVSGTTHEEAKKNFYAHGAESPLHRERYNFATAGEKAEFSKKLDEYLREQGN